MTSDIQKLREQTGAGVMECKRALEKAHGNFEQAVNIIHEQGIVLAEKKSARKTGAGILDSYIHNNRVGVLLELHCETDFVARSEPFRTLAHELSMQVAAMAPEDVEALLAQPYIKDESMAVKDIVKRTIAQLGENIKVERFCRYEI
jgi:elongation factor Ts